MPDKLTTEQIRDRVSKAFEEALTEEEVAALGHPNPIKCMACKIGLYTAAGALLAAAIAVGLDNIEDDEELVEVLADFYHVSKVVIEEWLQEAYHDHINSVKSLVHYLCKKAHACK
jgi:hypothetical protein